MSHQAIAQIEKAEEAARAVLLEAQDKAREQLSKAQELAAQKAAETKRLLLSRSNEAAEAQRRKDEAYAAEQLEAARLDCRRLREDASGRMEQAIALVMERVMN